MIDCDKTSPEHIREAHDTLLKIGETSLKLAAIKRALIYSDGERESDAEHSFHLLYSALYLARNYFPELDRDGITQFCIVHDMAEIYAGDTLTLNISTEARIAKEQAEKESVQRLLTELDPETSDYLERYERQEEPEARFVRAVDKLCPSIIQAVAPDENRESFIEQSKYKNIDDVKISRATRRDHLMREFPEFEFIISDLKSALADTSDNRLFGTEED